MTTPVVGGTKVPQRYIPTHLSSEDKTQQKRELRKSRRLYKHGIYHRRKTVKSFKSKKSKWLQRAEKIYGVDKISANKELANASGCSINALRKIVNKGAGAYYSSGSRPNQTAQSWGIARLASALAAGKAAAVDYKILENGCLKSGKAMTYARKARRKFGTGHNKTLRTKL